MRLLAAPPCVCRTMAQDTNLSFAPDRTARLDSKNGRLVLQGGVRPQNTVPTRHTG
jgi:hypothetical protein